MAATDASIVDGGDRVVLQRVGRRFHRQRRAAGQADAGVIAGTCVFIDTEALAHDALAAFGGGRHQRLRRNDRRRLGFVLPGRHSRPIDICTDDQRRARPEEIG